MLNKKELKPPFNPRRFFVNPNICIFTIIILLNLFFKYESLNLQSENIKNQKKLLTRWKNLIKSYSIPKNALELYREFSFPKSEIEREPIYLFTPMYFCTDQKGNIFISDMYEHSIKKFNSEGIYLDKIGKGGQAPGELLMPSFIEIDNKNKPPRYFVWVLL